MRVVLDASVALLLIDPDAKPPPHPQGQPATAGEAAEPQPLPRDNRGLVDVARLVVGAIYNTDWGSVRYDGLDDDGAAIFAELPGAPLTAPERPDRAAVIEGIAARLDQERRDPSRMAAAIEEWRERHWRGVFGSRKEVIEQLEAEWRNLRQNPAPDPNEWATFCKWAKEIYEVYAAAVRQAIRARILDHPLVLEWIGGQISVGEKRKLQQLLQPDNRRQIDRDAAGDEAWQGVTARVRRSKVGRMSQRRAFFLMLAGYAMEADKSLGGPGISPRECRTPEALRRAMLKAWRDLLKREPLRAGSRSKSGAHEIVEDLGLTLSDAERLLDWVKRAPQQNFSRWCSRR